ncbi:PREDICTED: zinc finger CCCH-type antiviral protein 1-like [Nanorana parkeri]|uniref:zinc finger CCCH-type antiviral protein 1-like n=1 Tax=Nanorana parkeri TaxID=125878 RepID=UPI00085424EF|nr:PREDICTED: zinc finger CCCH-type antiviral protein 1-like [Nanorana parkeri]
MSDPTVTSYLTKLLCSHGGRLERNQLDDLLELPAEQIEQILEDEPLRFPQNSQMVLARSPLRICNRYLHLKGKEEEEEEKCPKLHMCHQYLRGQCPPNRRPPCRFSHSVLSDHNCAVLKANELSTLNEDEIKVLLLQNDNQLLPENCEKYMHSNCDQGEDCSRLHVCRYFIRGQCNNRFCKRSHNLLGSKSLLTCSWLSQETIQNFQILCVLTHNERHQAQREESKHQKPRDARGRSRGRSRRRTGDRRRAGSQDLLKDGSRERIYKALPEKMPEICPCHIWENCVFGELCSVRDNSRCLSHFTDTCANMHYHLPYRWQMFNRTDWEDLPNMEKLEKAFSDPSIDCYYSVDFQLMRSDTNPVRRLSTPSSLTRSSTYGLNTKWIWYWKDELGTWTKCRQSNTDGVSSLILSSELETIYLSKPTGTIPITSSNQKYILNCQRRLLVRRYQVDLIRSKKLVYVELPPSPTRSAKENGIEFQLGLDQMRLQHVYFMTEWEVRRRPRFLDSVRVKILRRSIISDASNSKQEPADSPAKAVDYPPKWDLKTVPHIGYQNVRVPQTCDEFSNIVKVFSKTLPEHKVEKMWRVQNPTLWQAYQCQKDQMKKNLGVNVDERQLFYGTNFVKVTTICMNNFDWNVQDTHAPLYGQGNYFARDASYAHKYSPDFSMGTRTMFVARVLVHAKGNPAMGHRPQKDRSADSCVNSVTDPSVFAVFEKSQVYPEYILEYKKEKKKSACIIS